MQGIARDISTAAKEARAQKGLWAGLLAFSKSPRAIQGLVVISDVLAIFLSSILFYLIRVNAFPDIEGHPFWVAMQAASFWIPCWIFLFWFSGVYINVHNRALFDEYYSVLKVVLFGFFVLLAAIYVADPPVPSGQRSYRFINLLLYFLLVAGSIGLGRYLIRILVRRLRRKGIGLRKTIIIGDSQRSHQLIDMFLKKPELGYEMIGTIATAENVSEKFRNYQLGTLDDLDEIIQRRQVEVSVLGTEHERDLVLRLMTETAVSYTTIKIIPDLYDIVSGQARAHHLYGIPLIEVNPRIMPVWEQHLKRLLDVAFSSLVLVFGLPFWLIVAVIIKLSDRGPVLYAQERLGLSGKQFMMYKFRSMRTDAEKFGISWTSQNDPRVTSIGKILRKLHIDEVPQFWNVLMGDMSIVGPRPERPFYVEKYSKLLPAYPRRLRVKPGLTGWNQVQAGEIVENVEFVQERLRHDFFYIENMSLRLDIEIIFRTILRVIQRKGQA